VNSHLLWRSLEWVNNIAVISRDLVRSSWL
jgi:hypothetical protein